MLGPFASPRPLWLRYLLAFGTALILLVALVVVVSSPSSTSQATDSLSGRQANREARIIVAQDQSPHQARLNPGAGAAPALNRAIRAYMTRQIATGVFPGPLQRARCILVRSRGHRQAFRCAVTAADAGYAFLGVVDTRGRRVTYCKRDPAPIPALDVPISRRCTA